MMLLLLTSLSVSAQNYVVNSSYDFPSYESMIIDARYRVNRFNEYYTEAYNHFNKKDYSGFIYYSDLALDQEFYTAQLFYDRGFSFEQLHQFSKAKKEYKKAYNMVYMKQKVHWNNAK